MNGNLGTSNKQHAQNLIDAHKLYLKTKGRRAWMGLFVQASMSEDEREEEGAKCTSKRLFEDGEESTKSVRLDVDD